jgi:lipid-binding SYLF domain-containing protein
MVSNFTHAYGAPAVSKPSRRAALATWIGGRQAVQSSLGGVMPGSLPEECIKAQGILANFTGHCTKVSAKPSTAKQIPAALLQEAQGLIIFSALRTGLTVVSPLVGHGVLVARLPGNRWSCPASLNVQTMGSIGLGINTVDCVLLLRTRKAVDMFASGKCVLGEHVPIREGPFGPAPFYRTNPEQVPIYGYCNARGLFLGKTNVFKGLELRHRQAEDEAFYHCHASCEELIFGRVQSQAPALAGLMGLVSAVTGDPGAQGAQYSSTSAHTPPVAPVRGPTINAACISSQTHRTSTDPLFYRDAAIGGDGGPPFVTQPMPVAAHPHFVSQMNKLHEMGFRDKSRNAELLEVYSGDVGRVAEVLRHEDIVHRERAVSGTRRAQSHISIWR